MRLEELSMAELVDLLEQVGRSPESFGKSERARILVEGLRRIAGEKG